MCMKFQIMAEECSLPSHKAALGSTATLLQASTQTTMDSANQKSLSHPPAASWMEQSSRERSMALNNTQLQEESVIDLKIQVAVLKNDLAHKELERQEAVNACRIIANILGSGYAREFGVAGKGELENIGSQHPSEKWRILEREVDLLQRENVLLWRTIDTHNRYQSVHSLVKSDGDISDAKPRERRVSGRESSETTADKALTTYARNCPGDRLSLQPTRDQLLNACPSISAELEPPRASNGNQETNITPDAAAAETKAWGQSFQDVGLESLDDVIGPDGSDVPPPTRPAKDLLHRGDGPQSLQEDAGINDQMKNYMESMISLQNLPAPAVLKTGFDLNGSFRGGDYSLIPQRPKAFTRSSFSRNLSFSDSFESSSSSERLVITNRTERVTSPARRRDEAHGFRRHYSRVDNSESFGNYAGFFRYGIQYAPSETDSNYMRRIIISNLPRDIVLKDVLAQVRGGVIVNANLLDTQRLTGGMTVMIQFMREESVKEYLAYTKDHPIHFGSCAQKAEFELVNTPTWPLETGLHPFIISQKQTRCLAIPDFPEDLCAATLERHIAGHYGFRSSSLVDIYTDEQGTLHLEFSSMVDAHFAYSILTQSQLYSELKPIFTLDPCARAIEKLASPLPPRETAPQQSQTLSRIPQDSSNDNDSRSKSAVQQKDQSEVEPKDSAVALPGQTVIIPSFPDSKHKYSSWADEVIDEAENNQRNPRKPPVGLARSKYASTIPRFSDLAMHKSNQEAFSTDLEEGKHVPVVTERVFLQNHTTFKVETKDFAYLRNQSALEGGFAHTLTSISSHNEYPTSPSRAEAGPKKECLQTPPRIRLDTLLESSPPPPASNSQDPVHSEQRSVSTSPSPHNPNLSEVLQLSDSLPDTTTREILGAKIMG